MTKFAEGNVELSLEIRHPPEVLVRIGSEPFDRLLQVGDDRAGGFEIVSENVVA